MELIQVNWDENENLFLKFQKDQDEVERINHENVRNINVQYNLFRNSNDPRHSESPSFWFSTKKSYFTEDTMGIAIELEEIHNYDEVLIDLLNLSIIYNSGKKDTIFINEEFPLAEIFTNDACYLDFPRTQIKNKETKNTEITIKQKRSIKISTVELNDVKKISLLEKKAKVKNGTSLKKNKLNSSNTLTIENYKDLNNIEDVKDLPALMFIIRETFNRLNSVEQELKETNATLREVALRNAEALCNNNGKYSIPPPNPPSLIPPQSFNALPQRKLSLGPPKRIENNASTINVQLRAEVIREMKEKFENISNVKDILQKVPEKILKRDIPRTDHLSFIEFKENQLVNDK